MYYTWVKSVESPSPPPQRNPDVELGHGTNTNNWASKGQPDHAVLEQVTDEKDTEK